MPLMTITPLNRRLSGLIVGIVAILAANAAPPPIWGRLANPGFNNHRMKATYFFTGEQRDGSNPYGATPPAPLDTRHLNTRTPADPAQLQWHTNPANRELVLNQMIAVGINVVSMSSWGERFTPATTNSGWAAWAPMQTSRQSHDELFTAAIGRPLLIVPFIESRAEWKFMDEFPRWIDGRPSPGTVSQITEFINNYLISPSNPGWPGKWARFHDRNGVERYAVGIIHAASNRLNPGEDAAFATGFDTLADEVFNITGVRVGFLLDLLPQENGADFKASPESTGPLLSITDAVLGIQCFIPEIFPLDLAGTSERLAWKQDFTARWFQTGVPFIVDLCPGYDGHIVFADGPSWGYSTSWLNGLSKLVEDFGRNGAVVNSWNGYTEGMVVVPTLQDGDFYYRWIGDLPNHDSTFVNKVHPGLESGSQTYPYRNLSKAIHYANDGEHIQIQTALYSEQFTIDKNLTLQAIGGPVTIGHP